MSDTDLELLTRYVRDGSQDAFGELARRHLPLVYSAALRQVRSPQTAEDVAQSVFVDLARYATRLRAGTVLSAWLYEVTHRTAVDFIRREVRREERERIAIEMNTLHHSSADWQQIAPLLEEAMHILDAVERAAVLLRYFEGKSFKEVGLALGTNDDTTQKRVSRALDRLREHFTRHGVTLSSTALATALSANAVHSAPAALLVTISTGGALLGSGAALVATKTIAMTTTQKALTAAGLAVAVAVGVFQAQRNAALQSENTALKRAHELTLAELEQLRALQTAGLAPAATPPADRDRSNDAELLRLRGEIARLRREAQEAAADLKQANADLIDAWSKVPAYKTLVAMANETLSRDDALVAGGWKTPDGRRALAFVTTEPMDDGRTVTVTTKLIEYTEEAAEQVGLKRFQSGSGESMFGRTQVIPADEVRQLLGQLEKIQGVNLLTAPRLTTGSGRQGQVKVVNGRKLPNGEDYELGPMLDFVPTVTADGQSVHLRMVAQINLAIPRPGQPEAPKE